MMAIKKFVSAWLAIFAKLFHSKPIVEIVCEFY